MERKRTIRQLEKIRSRFVEDYPIDRIRNLTLDEYVIGRGSSNRSFCYRLEIEMKEYGGFQGARADKFGVYYGTFGEDTTAQYRCSKKFSKRGNIDEAFARVKEEIVRLLEAGARKDIDAIRQSALGPTFRGKLLNTYYPEDYLPIFAEKYLVFFLDRLEIPYEGGDMLDMQRKLIEWKNAREDSKDLSLLEFQQRLYERYDPKQWKKRIEANLLEDSRLSIELDDTPDSELPKDHAIRPTKKVALKKKNGIEIYPRNPVIAKEALQRADYRCEIDAGHKSFIRRKDRHRYMEAHHLIPLSEHSQYSKSLDNLANIVSLCSECHNRLHYGEDAEKLIAVLHEQRKSDLDKAGIGITLDELLKIYRGEKL